MKAEIFSSEFWYLAKFDARKKAFRGITREEFAEAARKHNARGRVEYVRETRLQRVKSDLNYFAGIPYEYAGDGLDDFSRYQRPASNGRGWVAICPGEPGNNYYTEDPATVAILRRRYDKYMNERGK